MAYYVYVLLCSNGSYYTGYARNVMSRFRQHERGLGARYTRIHKPEKVVHIEKFHTRREAVRREKTIKRLSHTQKKKLTSTREAKPGYAMHISQEKNVTK